MSLKQKIANFKGKLLNGAKSPKELADILNEINDKTENIEPGGKGYKEVIMFVQNTGTGFNNTSEPRKINVLDIIMNDFDEVPDVYLRHLDAGEGGDVFMIDVDLHTDITYTIHEEVVTEYEKVEFNTYRNSFGLHIISYSLTTIAEGERIGFEEAGYVTAVLQNSTYNLSSINGDASLKISIKVYD